MPKDGIKIRRLVSPGEVLADDRKRAKVRRTIQEGVKRKGYFTLGDWPTHFKRPSLLGPVLNERFGGASSSSSASRR